MPESPASRAAALLLDARRSGRPLDALPAGVRPSTAAEAYAIQDAVARELGPVAAWKVGAAGPQAEPTCAPIVASCLFASPRRFAPGSFRVNGIEAEIAFTLARDLPPRAAPYTAAEARAAIASVHPAIEVVDSRFADRTAVDPLSALADFGNHGALVVGAGSPLDPASDPLARRVRLTLDESLVADHVGGNAAVDLVRLLAWLANHAAGRCGGLRRGQIVTTGTCTGLAIASPPTAVLARFDGLGEVAVDL